ncbi:hypothetical protein SAY87_017604 [Trapa incisa]|uniref:Uncharacterized protein n=1 Tax=Trapa incisa TaxID=236973 RepID=A0AAN7L123_9MYRT|nr:hypothetical protein SAY87_017604 [Trapa incisa]
MAAVPKPVRIYTFLMALLFGYSAFVHQLDDSDWYLWLPLYIMAYLVNLGQIDDEKDSKDGSPSGVVSVL